MRAVSPFTLTWKPPSPASRPLCVPTLLKSLSTLVLDMLALALGVEPAVTLAGLPLGLKNQGTKFLAGPCHVLLDKSDGECSVDGCNF